MENSQIKIKQKIITYLSNHQKVTLATVTPEGDPIAHTVVYVNEGAIMYFRSRNVRRKYLNIMNNPSIAYAVDEYPGDDWCQLLGVQMTGKATIVEAGEKDRINQLFEVKYPRIEQFIPRETPGLEVIRIDPIEGFWLDYRKSFGNREPVSF